MTKRRNRTEIAAEKALTEGRSLYEDIQLPGLGYRLYQIIERPSFSPGNVWDIRELDGNLFAFKSTIEDDLPPIPEDSGAPQFHRIDTSAYAYSQGRIAAGYAAVKIEQKYLLCYHQKITSLQIPLIAKAPDMMLLDGTTYEVILYAPNDCRTSLQWAEEGPEEWRACIDATQELLKEFNNWPIEEIDHRFRLV